MIQKINRETFIVAFKQAGRESQFSRDALCALFEYLEESETELNQIELDVIALCCEYTEDTTANVLKEYSLDSLDELKQNTTVIELDEDSIIYANF